MTVADIVVICIILVFTFIGWKRGLVLSLFSTFSIVIAIVIGLLLRSPVSSVINSTALPDNIERSVYNFVESSVDEETIASLDVKSEELMTELKLPDFIKDYVSDNVLDDFKEGSFENVANEISQKASNALVSVISFVIIAVLAIIIMIILKFVLKALKELPAIKQLDILGGILFGVASGVLIVCVLALLLTIFSSTDGMQSILKSVEDSLIAKYFYDNNFLGKIISGLIK